MLHNLCVPIQRWSSPVVGRVKGVVVGGLCAAVAVGFFQPWFGITAAAVTGVLSLANLVLGARVTLDTEAGVLVLRWGLLIRRVRLADITRVLAEDSKLSIARARGGEISVYLWGRGAVDRWLGLPLAAGDIGHAVASASALARSAAEDLAGPESRGAQSPGGDSPDAVDAAAAGWRRPSAASRSVLATVLLGSLGLLSVCAALLVRHSWHNPVMSVLAVILALLLGVGGVFYVCLSAALFASSTRESRHQKLAG
jgi:hypothetical protein